MQRRGVYSAAIMVREIRVIVMSRARANIKSHRGAWHPRQIAIAGAAKRALMADVLCDYSPCICACTYNVRTCTGLEKACERHGDPGEYFMRTRGAEWTRQRERDRGRSWSTLTRAAAAALSTRPVVLLPMLEKFRDRSTYEAFERGEG